MPFIFRWYRNSFLASLVSITGCACIFGGITAGVEGFKREFSADYIFGGVVLIAVGILLNVWAGKISENKARKKAEKMANQAAGLSGNAGQTIASEANAANTAARPSAYTGATETTGQRAAYSEKASEPQPRREPFGASRSSGADSFSDAYVAGMGASSANASANGKANVNAMTLEQVLELARRYGDSGLYKQQLDILRHGEELYPQNAEIRNLEGIAWRNLGDCGQAFTCYQKAMELEPDNPVFISNAAIARMSGGDAQEALSLFERALPLLKRANNANYPSALANYALALAKCGYSENAVRCLREAEQLGYPNVAGLRSMLEGMGIFYH